MDGTTNFKTIRTMKATKFISAALIVFVAASCIKENITDNFQAFDQEPMTISNPETKTVLNSDYSVNWTAGDEIAIYDNLGGKNIFTNSTESVATFSGNVTLGTTQFWGIYPAGLVESFNNGTAVVTLPADQTPAAGTFAEDVNISIAQGSKTPGTELVENITFSNVCGLISFTVPSNIAAHKVTFSTESRDLAGTLNVNFENSTVAISGEGSKSLTMEGDFAAGSTFYFVATPGAIAGFKIEVDTKLGSFYYKSTQNGSINVVAGEIAQLGLITFKDGVATAEAAHVYEEGTLVGSTLTVNHGIPSNVWNDVTALTVSVEKDGKTYRSYTTSKITEATVIPTGNIYLPQGQHTIKVDYVMNGVNTTRNSSVTVPAPVVAIEVANVAGTTSYEVEGDNVIKTNNIDGRTVSAATLSFTANVSADVLNDYPAIYEFTIGGATKSGNATSTTVSGVDVTGVAVGEHTLTGKVTFDGISASAQSASTDIVTGIPCSFNFFNNKDAANNSDWNLNNVTWSTGTSGSKCSIFANGTDGNLITPQFYAPSDINVTCSNEVQYYVALLRNVSSYTSELHIGVTNSSTTVASTYTTHTISGNNNTGKNFSTVSTDLTISNTNPYISFHHNSPSQPKGTFGIKAEWWYLNLGNIVVSYK